MRTVLSFLLLLILPPSRLKDFTRSTSTLGYMNYRVAQTFPWFQLRYSSWDNKPRYGCLQEKFCQRRHSKEIRKWNFFRFDAFSAQNKPREESEHFLNTPNKEKHLQHNVGDMERLKGKSSTKKRMSESRAHSRYVGALRSGKNVKRRGSSTGRGERKRWWENLWRRKVFFSILYYYEENFKSSEEDEGGKKLLSPSL